MAERQGDGGLSRPANSRPLLDREPDRPGLPGPSAQPQALICRVTMMAWGPQGEACV